MHNSDTNLRIEISLEISEFHIAHAEKGNGIAKSDVPRR